MRISKFIANAGICSRRKAESLINQKQVRINGVLCTHPSTKVATKDKIEVNGSVIQNNQFLRLWKMYKPIKFICTNNDPQQRKKVFDLIPKNYPRVISVGRLDYMSEGLLLFTNNGDYARKLELPSSNFQRTYRVCIKDRVKKENLKLINEGITIKKLRYNKINVIIEKITKHYTWLIVKLNEGKNREIRKIFEYFSLDIVKLIRIQYGPYKLLNLKKGQIIEIKNIF